VTVAAIPVSRSLASEFGVIETAPDGRIIGFHEKNANAPCIPGDPDRVFASMGNYIFSTRSLLRELYDDAANPASKHDFGRDILPSLVGRGEMFAYDFQTNQIPGEPAGAPVYWRDVGTIDAYYEANIDLRSVSPALNLYNREWPLRTASYPDAPAKFTFDDEDRRGQAIDSIISGACILSGGAVRNSVLFRGVKVHSGALIEDSVILDSCDIGRRAKVRRAILDKNVRIPADAEIGYDLDHDRRYHHVTESGIVVVGGNRSSVEVSTLFV
jgi:glucose-1-phosphate adenylyltransferase